MVKKSKMTIKDIAALAGVSTMTVSRVINSPHLVRPVTLERVRRIMEKHYYVYDAGAADLVKKRSALTRLITPTIKLPFFAEVTYVIQKTAQEKGYTVIIGNRHYPFYEISEGIPDFLVRIRTVIVQRRRL